MSAQKLKQDGVVEVDAQLADPFEASFDQKDEEERSKAIAAKSAAEIELSMSKV